MRVPNPAAGTIAAIRLIEGLTVYRKKTLPSQKTVCELQSDKFRKPSEQGHAMSVATVLLSAWLWFVAPALVHPQGVSVVEIADIQVAQSLSAVVTDSAMVPMEGVTIEEMSTDCKTRIRATKTDSTGKFTLPTVRGRTVYYFELTYNGFDPLRVRIRVDEKRGKTIQLQMTFAT
jgi:Carboxypeptidase regulatory-like domain